MQISNSFSIEMHVKLYTPVPLSGSYEVIAIFTNPYHCQSFLGPRVLIYAQWALKHRFASVWASVTGPKFTR